MVARLGCHALEAELQSTSVPFEVEALLEEFPITSDACSEEAIASILGEKQRELTSSNRRVPKR